jgi:predicted RNase H-like nuclease
MLAGSMSRCTTSDAWVAGADGCRAGWVVAERRVRSEEVVIRVVSCIAALLEGDARPAVLGIDVPIGLLDAAAPGGRACDREARRLLGEPRARSVFSPPVRRTLTAKSYEDALRRNGSIGISRQCYGILPKIREVDERMTRSLQKRVVEVHPELVFYELNRRRALAESKKSPAGLQKRIRLLERAWGFRLSPIIEAHRSAQVARDDIVDAMAVCWTAERVLEGKECRIPDRPPLDSRGLRMEIVR